jgi:HK97 family phage prohead protease
VKIKSFHAPLTLKADDSGLVSAVFSTFNVVDKQGDIVLATAFTHGQEVLMTWSHDWSSPVGRGTILVEPTQAVFDGKFFMDTQAGHEAFKTVRNAGILQEWSWGFETLDASFEQRDGEYVRIIKRARVFEVAPVLVGAGEGTHTLAIKSAQPLESHADAVLAAVSTLAERLRLVGQLRAKEGRAISTARRERIGQISDQLASAAADLKAILDETAPAPKGASRDAITTLRLRTDTDRLLARLRANGIGVPA